MTGFDLRCCIRQIYRIGFWYVFTDILAPRLHPHVRNLG